MRTHERLCGDVVVLDLHGRLAARAVDVELWAMVRSLSQRGHRKLVLNLADATSSNPFGVSTLLGAMLTAREEGGELKLLHVARGIDDLKLLVELYDHLEVFESEPEALESFGVAPAPATGTLALGRRLSAGAAA
jgi:anti-anti-sigma regulatory factor